MNQNKLVVVDTFFYLHRAFHAYPSDLRTTDGRVVNMLFGFTASIVDLLNTFQPTHLIFPWETINQPSFRRDIYKQYQANRAFATDPEEEELFRQQIPYIYEFIDTLNTEPICVDGFEGDDIIGTVSTLAKKAGYDVVIASNDQDMLQLIDSENRIQVYNSGRPPFIKSRLFDQNEFREKYKFLPHQMIDYKALRGDPSDNIPGVAGIGEKYATNLLLEYETLDNIYENIDNITSNSLKNKLLNGKNEAYISQQLATIITEVPLDISIDSYLINIDYKKLDNYLNKWEFRSIDRKVSKLKNTYSTQSTDQNQMPLI